MLELSFFSTRFITVSMFSSINLVQGGLGNLEGETSAEATNLLITLDRRNCKEVDIVTI